MNTRKTLTFRCKFGLIIINTKLIYLELSCITPISVGMNKTTKLGWNGLLRDIKVNFRLTLTSKKAF